MEPLETALGNYLGLLRSVLTQARETVRPSVAPPEISPSEDDHLRSTANALERQPEFGTLVRLTATEFSRSDFEREVRGMWESLVGNFFRLSGLYQDPWSGGRPNASIEKSYRDAFRAPAVWVTYFAPLEYVEFGEERMDFGQFQIRRFGSEELDGLLNNRALRVFYPHAFINTERLTQHWLFVCRAREEVSPLDFDMPSITTLLEFERSPFPRDLARGLRSLLLYPWHRVDVFPRDIDVAGTRRVDATAAPVLFHIPFLLRTSDCLISSPRSAPDVSTLTWEPYINGETGEERGWVPLRGVTFSEPEMMNFCNFVRGIVGLLDEVVEDGPPQWTFMDTALDFLVKASFASGLEGLLWHIIAIESLLGQKGSGVTRLLKSRIGLVLAVSEQERKNVRAKFDELYEFRSELVHGNAKLEKRSIQIGHLGEAREMMRLTAIWMLRYLHHIRTTLRSRPGDLPSRETVLAALDMDERRQREVSALLPCLPKGFPNASCWTG